ncbi:hypothetical protein, partial [Pseudomonas sp. BS-2016]|uniref:hypothetical protein n=1 Tax=Pseudomonas sp. BS-2016 TaxID=1907766 RepID=UPI001C439C61
AQNDAAALAQGLRRGLHSLSRCGVAREAPHLLIQIKAYLPELLLSAVSIQYGLIHVLSRNPHRHP